MSHMVIFRTPEGKPGYQPADAVEDAIAIVERLRNDDGVENVRIFRLEEVAFEYRPYYKVELAGAAPDTSSADSGSSDASSSDQPTPIFGGQVGSGDSSGESDTWSDDAAAEEDEPAGSTSVFEVSGDDVPPPAPEQPPWAAPPPPPVVEEPAGEVGGFGDRDEPSDDSDDDYSGAGQRRGLFGR